MLHLVDLRNNPDIGLEATIALCRAVETASSGVTLKFTELTSSDLVDNPQLNLGSPLIQQPQKVSAYMGRLQSVNCVVYLSVAAALR